MAAQVAAFPNMLAGPWMLIKEPTGSNYLVYQGANGIRIVGPVFRYNKAKEGHLRSWFTKPVHTFTGTLSPDAAEARSFFSYEDPQETPELVQFWTNFQATVALTPEYTLVTESFYDAELGAQFQAKRNTQTKTPVLDLGPNHRNYNISHNRVMLGIRGVAVWDQPDVMALLSAYFPGMANGEIHPYGGATVAYVMEKAQDPKHFKSDFVERPDINMMVVRFSLALCSLDDHYNRKIGAAKAVASLETYISDPASANPQINAFPPEEFSRAPRFKGTGTFAIGVHVKDCRPTKAGEIDGYYEIIYSRVDIKFMILVLIFEKLQNQMEEWMGNYFTAHENRSVPPVRALHRMVDLAATFSYVLHQIEEAIKAMGIRATAKAEAQIVPAEPTAEPAPAPEPTVDADTLSRLAHAQGTTG